MTQISRMTQYSRVFDADQNYDQHENWLCLPFKVDEVKVFDGNKCDDQLEDEQHEEVNEFGEKTLPQRRYGELHTRRRQWRTTDWNYFNVEEYIEDNQISSIIRELSRIWKIYIYVK